MTATGDDPPHHAYRDGLADENAVERRPRALGVDHARDLHASSGRTVPSPAAAAAAAAPPPSPPPAPPAPPAPPPLAYALSPKKVDAMTRNGFQPKPKWHSMSVH